MTGTASPAPLPPGGSAPPRLVAVVDVGATAVRMEVAEVSDGRIRTLEDLARPVALGKDTFTSGSIQRATIEECVAILRQFRRVLATYGIGDMRDVRAVATSAVREARNRERFLNRVYMATGIPLECIDDAEMSRLTYLAVSDTLARAGVPRPWSVLVLEVGGGSTEMLLLQDDHVTASETLRLGSLRLRETLETYRAPPQRVRPLLEQSIERAISQMRRTAPRDPQPTMLAMSGDARLAAAQLVPDWPDVPLGVIAPSELEAFTRRLLDLSVDDVVRRYRITYPEAETLGPALLTYCLVSRAFGVERILVPKIHLRTALELEMAGGTRWTEDFAGRWSTPPAHWRASSAPTSATRRTSPGSAACSSTRSGRSTRCPRTRGSCCASPPCCTRSACS